MISGSSSELAIYFLIDHSASMSGPAFYALLDAYFSILTAVEQEYVRIERLYSVMAYESTPTELLRRGQNAESIPISVLLPQGSSKLGKAWSVLHSWRIEDRSSGLCFILTDGFPTDDLVTAYKELDRSMLILVGIGCGREANLSAMMPFVDAFVIWHECDAENFSSLLRKASQQLLMTNFKANDDGNTVFS